MNIDQLMTDTFAAHEHLAANDEDVLAAVQWRIAHRRSRLARPLAIAAGVAVVVGAAGAAVVLTNHTGASRAHHPAAQQAAAQQHGNAARRGTRAPARITEPTMPFDLGWLPAGTVDYGARRINLGGVSETSPPSLDGEYLLTVTGADHAIQIDVQQTPGALNDAHFKSGPGVNVSIDGQPGIESRNSSGPGGYELYFRDADGGVMYVNAFAPPATTIPAAELTAVGRRVAENVRFPGTTRVPVAFGIGYLPAGMRVRAFDVESGGLPGYASGGGSATLYDLGNAHTQQSGVTVAESELPAMSGGKAGRSVQGHPTRYSVDQGYLTLDVLDAVDGHTVEILTRLPLSEAYKIADGLILPS